MVFKDKEIAKNEAAIGVVRKLEGVNQNGDLRQIVVMKDGHVQAVACTRFTSQREAERWLKHI